MDNRDIAVALQYHTATKHSPISIRTSGHYLDFHNKPLPFKVYTTVEPIPLLRECDPLPVPALAAIASRGDEDAVEGAPNLETLSRVLHHAAGITKIFRYRSGDKHYFRAAACTGALYHIDVYLACGTLPDLEAGVYHFSPHDHALRRLRVGDYRQVLVQATAEHPAVARAPVVVVCTGTYWRNSWKYQDRTYRHFGWDNGTLLANLLAEGVANKLQPYLLCGFVDDSVNRLLDLNVEKEVATSLVALGRTSEPVPPAPAVDPLDLPTTPLSRHGDVDHPLMRRMQAASSLQDAAEVAAWRQAPPETLSPAELPPSPPLEEVILRRGSTRRFSRDPITREQLSTVLQASSRGIAADSGPLNDMYVIANAVSGLDSGSYFYHEGTFEPLRLGDFRAEAGYLDLEQDLAEDAAANVYFMADLNPILERYGNRGYRAVQLEAGLRGGKQYLAAYAQGFGASGLTFYDDEVTSFFSPHAAGKSTIFLMALGYPYRKRPAS